MSSTCEFQARVWIFRIEVFQRDVWVHEFEPTDATHRASSEWVTEHLSNYSAEDYAEMFGLELHDDKGYQVLFRGQIRGSFDWQGEYDEEFDVTESSFREVPKEYFVRSEFFEDDGG